jgi:hypothetical protein
MSIVRVGASAHLMVFVVFIWSPFRHGASVMRAA